MPVSVPQFTDVEDTLVGPFTAKQLGWFGLGGVIIFLLFTIFEGKTFYFLSALVALIVIAFAYYKPYGQPLINFIGHLSGFFMRPKTYIWKRTFEEKMEKSEKIKKIPPKQVKKFSPEEVRKISKILDTEGTEVNGEDIGEKEGKIIFYK